MDWLSQTREALRIKDINLSGSFEPTPKENGEIQQIINEVRDLIHSLGSEKGNEKIQKLTDSFCEYLEKSLIRILKGRRRGIKKGHIDRTNIINQDVFQQLLQQYQESINLVFGWSNKLTSRIFKASSTITPYWEMKKLSELLTDGNIQKKLEEKGVKMELEEVEKLFTDSVKKRFAVDNITNPMEAVERVAHHLTVTLTDGNIQKKLAEKGVKMELEEINELFTDGMKKHFAVKNITDPLDGCVKYAKGEISYNGKFLN